METQAQRDERVARLAEHRALRSGGEQRAMTRASLPSSMVGVTPVAGVAAVTVRGALQLPDVMAAVQMVAGLFAAIPLDAVQDTPAGEGHVPVPDAAAQALLDRPEDGLAPSAWRARLGVHMLMWREAFIGLARDGDGRVAALTLLDPAVVGVEIVAGRRIYTVPDALGTPRRLTPADVVHCMGPSLDGLRALSPVRESPLAFQMARAVAEHALRSFAGGARVQTVVSVRGQGPAGEELMTGLRRDLNARPDGVAVVDGEAVSVQQLGASNVQSDMIAAGRWASQLVMRALGLPAALVGEQTGGSMDYSNTEAQTAAVAGLHVRPLFEAVASALSLNPELFPGRLRARWAFEDLPADPERGFGTAPTTSPAQEGAPA